ncbi:MAG: ArsI/CadI family heavy metal resistance metalloenzyme [Pyrinomonadaceae bacterium]
MEGKSQNTVHALKAHLALNVQDVQKSLEFYRKMLDIEPSKVRTGYAKFDVQNPPLNLTLNEVAFNGRGALSHLGIQVASTDDVLAMRDKWANSGLTTRDEMQTNCCYATQDKTWVQDPDGNEWEVFVVLKDNLAETSACCGMEGDALQEPTGITKASGTGPAAVEAASCCASPAAPSEMVRP